MKAFGFELLKTDRTTGARLGRLTTPHSVVDTPVFMPVGTAATVKACPQECLEELDARIILANTYHLYLRPGHERIRSLGGLHHFMSWNRSILFFDFLPIGLGKIQNFDVRIQLYTVPGQVMYNSTRRLVLKGVDGVVFVADSLVDRRKKNIISLKNLHENLLSYQKNIFKIPLVLQFNKRDIGQNGIPILNEEIMNSDLNVKLKAPYFLASARQGANVVNTLKSIIKLTVSAVEQNILQGDNRV